MRINKRCFFWHKKRLVKETPHNFYYECEKCLARKCVSKTGIGYVHADQQWVYKLRDNIREVGDEV